MIEIKDHNARVARLNEIKEMVENDPQLVELHSNKDVPWLLATVERLQKAYDHEMTIGCFTSELQDRAAMLDNITHLSAEVERLKKKLEGQ